MKLFGPQKIGFATVMITAFTLLSYVIGLIRDRIIAVHFGTSEATDTYNASFLIPDILFNMFVAGALAAAFLPIFSDNLQKNKERAHSLGNTMISSSVLLITVLGAITFIFVPQLVDKIFSDATVTMQADIIKMTRIILPSAILFAISNTLGNILMSYKHFMSYAISPVLYNLGIILGVVFMEGKLGIYSAAIGVLIGTFLHALIRIADTLTTDYKFKFEFKVKEPDFVKILRLMIPKSISLIGWQINLYIFAVVGIKITEGGLSAFSFARNIQSFAVSIFGVSLATAVFPYLANSIEIEDKKVYTEDIQKTTQRILFFTIPSAAGIIFLSKEIVELILSGGAFDEKSAVLTSTLLLFFGISIPFESLTHLFSRAFYALKNTKTPTIVHVIAMTTMAIMTITIAPKYGIKWLSIAFSAGFMIYTFLLILTLKKHLHDFKVKEFAISLAKTLFATALMVVIILLSSDLKEIMNPKFSHLLRILLGGSGFLLGALIVKSKEIESINYIMGRILKRKTL